MQFLTREIENMNRNTVIYEMKTTVMYMMELSYLLFCKFKIYDNRVHKIVQICFNFFLLILHIVLRMKRC